jgi:2-amino-4-hydroxy-6-hydroxymethyldihydropteridine diphosphokinase
MHQVFLGIGGNIGNKLLNFQKVQTYSWKKKREIVAKSSVYETPPGVFWPKKISGTRFCMLKLNLSPDELLHLCLKKSCLFGSAIQNIMNQGEMDIDILYFDELILSSDKLTVPHPHIPNRMFVLVPLAEIAPSFVHPVLKLTNRQLLEQCGDALSIKKN